MRTKLTASERREATRLRAERWRRAHGIVPRKPAERPWVAMGISRSTYYLRRAKARHEATSQAIYRNSEIALRDSAAQTRAVFERLEWQLAELRADLARAAEAQVVMEAIIGGVGARSLCIERRHMNIEEQGFLSPDIATFIDEHRAENRAWFDHAMDLNSIAQKVLMEIPSMLTRQSLAGAPSEAEYFLAALLFVRGLLSFQATILLIERGMVQDARTLARSCFETVFCFGALRKDPGFLEKFEKLGAYAKRVFADNLRKGKLERDVAEILSQFLDSLARSGKKGARLNWQDVTHLAGLDDVYNTYYRGLSGDAAHPSPTALKRYYKINGNNVELRFGPKALDEKDIEKTLVVSCAACWYLLAWMVERVDHPEINEKSRLCLEELKRLIEAARAADLT